MSQINLNSLTALLNTTFKTLLAVASICLFAVSANAADLQTNGNQSKISAQATVLVTGKSFTHNFTSAGPVTVSLDKVISFKTPAKIAGLDTDCTLTLNLAATKIKGVTLNSKCSIVATLPKGWKNDKDDNKKINATITFNIQSGEDYSSIKFVAKTGTKGFEAKWLKGTATSETNTFTVFVPAKTVKVKGVTDTNTTGAVVTLKTSSKIYADELFTATSTDIALSNVKTDSDNMKGEIKITFKNVKTFL